MQRAAVIRPAPLAPSSGRPSLISCTVMVRQMAVAIAVWDAGGTGFRNCGMGSEMGDRRWERPYWAKCEMTTNCRALPPFPMALMRQAGLRGDEQVLHSLIPSCLSSPESTPSSRLRSGWLASATVCVDGFAREVTSNFHESALVGTSFRASATRL